MILRANELFLQYDYLYQRGMPKCPIYSPRDVIVIKEYQTPVEESELSLAIVIGAIAKGDELRTDAAGMTSYDDIVRHATWEDLDNPDIKKGFATNLFTNRIIQEVHWHSIDLSDRYEQKTVCAFDTWFRCDRYRKLLSKWHTPVPLSYQPKGEVVDLLEFLTPFDKEMATTLKKKHGDVKAYKEFTLNTSQTEIFL